MPTLRLKASFAAITAAAALSLALATTAMAQSASKPAAKPAMSKPAAKAPAAKSFAQRLVESTQAKHPEADEIGISATTAKGCIGIASTDKSDIGEKCEADDVKPMQTGKPYVEKEKDGMDVSVPLHDATGKTVGVLGIGFKAAPGQTEASVTAMATKIAAELAPQIPSKAKLLAAN
ncbi:MAG TPA: PDC sensor domain-containing protein [Gemmatimonadales bacterium]|jgi:iron complex outermembrane receptor protein